MSKQFAEYIWLDGTEPTQQLRSKTRVIELTGEPTIGIFPEWGFDGSSTNQATGDNSDCILRPVSFVNDPIRGEGNFLVMCEVFDRHGNPHETNTRSILRQVLQAGAAEQDPLFGFEQEYTLFDENGPLVGQKMVIQNHKVHFIVVLVRLELMAVNWSKSISKLVLMLVYYFMALMQRSCWVSGNSKSGIVASKSLLMHC